MKKIFVNATNCHQGGGKTLLDSFISGLTDVEDSYIIFVDERYSNSFILNENITLVKIQRFKRLLVGFKIYNERSDNDTILYFGNLPPLLRYRNNKVILLLSNRFYVQNLIKGRMPFFETIKIFLEKTYFNFFKKNVNQFIVQTLTMRNLLAKKNINTSNISILPFENTFKQSESVYNKLQNTYIYVASLLVYKNHKNLLYAWKNLKDNGINPILYITVDQNNKLKKWIKHFVSKYNLNIFLLENLERGDLLDIYSKCEFLIYPSYFEAYGLPLIEARNFKLKVLASDTDFCWDIIKPDDFFNPFDIYSIERCIVRSLKIKTKPSKIYTPNEFINKII